MASAVLCGRVYALLFGLGGWFIGALVVLMALPAVPARPTSCWWLSRSGLPIGLGIYFAWTNRDWSAQTKAMGFAAAAGGALVGAWLGFHVTSRACSHRSLAIVGAAVGANLILLALDIAWDRQVRDRFAADAIEIPETRPATR